MSRRGSVDLFVEDSAHEAFLAPLIRRVASEEEVEVDIRVRSARGGHGKAVSEYRLFQEIAIRGHVEESTPDLVVVAIDGNCSTFAKKRAEIKAATNALFRDRLVTACPDPHIERWFLADPESFHSVVGVQPRVGKKKCARGYYKDLLAKAIRDAGHPMTLNGIEFAVELVEAMDLYRSGKAEASLKSFLEDLRGRLHGPFGSVR